MSKEYFTREREERRSYSRAVKVKGGTTVYLAGVVNRGADGKAVVGVDLAPKVQAVFERLRENVEVAGGTLDDIVTMTVFITDPRYGDEFVKLRSEFFKPGHCPASALITVSALGAPELEIEIQAIAVLDN